MLLAASLFAISAAATAERPDYTYIEAAYLNTDIDGSLDLDGDGASLDGSIELNEHVFLTASIASQDFGSGIDLDQRAIGIGVRHGLSDSLDLVGTVNWVDAEVDTPFGDADENGIGFSAGLRSRLGDSVELEGSWNWVNLDDAGDDTFASVDARWYLTPAFSFGVGADVGDDATTWKAGMRWTF